MLWFIKRQDENMWNFKKPQNQFSVNNHKQKNYNYTKYNLCNIMLIDGSGSETQPSYTLQLFLKDYLGFKVSYFPKSYHLENFQFSDREMLNIHL